jgi:hypothetical protein
MSAECAAEAAVAATGGPGRAALIDHRQRIGREVGDAATGLRRHDRWHRRLHHLPVRRQRRVSGGGVGVIAAAAGAQQREQQRQCAACGGAPGASDVSSGVEHASQLSQQASAQG